MSHSMSIRRAVVNKLTAVSRTMDFGVTKSMIIQACLWTLCRRAMVLS